jgi:hypothetical protein
MFLDYEVTWLGRDFLFSASYLPVSFLAKTSNHKLCFLKEVIKDLPYYKTSNSRDTAPGNSNPNFLWKFNCRLIKNILQPMYGLSSGKQVSSVVLLAAGLKRNRSFNALQCSQLSKLLYCQVLSIYLFIPVALTWSIRHPWKVSFKFSFLILDSG